MEKDKGGRPFGSFQGKEKKVTTSIKIEPRFRRAIVERYASFQEWFDSMVQKEFQGEDLKPLDEKSAKAEHELSNVEIKSVSGFAGTPDKITKEALEDGAQALKNNSAIPRHRVPQGIITIGKPATEEQIAKARSQFEGQLVPAKDVPILDENGKKVGTADVDLCGNARATINDDIVSQEIKDGGFKAVSMGYHVDSPKSIPAEIILGVQPAESLKTEEELKEIQEAFEAHHTGPGVYVPVLNLDALEKNTDDELKALEGDDQSNLDPFSQL